MMDYFKSEKIKSLFMGAGNAENTPSASAIADNVVFCWRSKFVKKEAEKCFPHEPKSSLMLYVDRISAAAQQSGKLFYSLAIGQADTLLIPKNRKELNSENGMFKLTSEDLEKGKHDADLENIRRITNMQGVAA